MGETEAHQHRIFDALVKFSFPENILIRERGSQLESNDFPMHIQ